MELKEAIQNRKSEREMCGSLTVEEIKLFWWVAYKIPSAGALYPLTIMYFNANMATNFVICADFKKTTVKYGERGKRYVYMEAGHMAQNISLTATEMGFACYCIGEFDDEKMKQMLKTELNPIYIIRVGHK